MSRALRLTETAYAKINLALHVRRRREDGYHELETLFAFVDAGDVLTASNAAQDSVNVLGEFAEHVHAVLGSTIRSTISSPRRWASCPAPRGWR